MFAVLLLLLPGSVGASPPTKVSTAYNQSGTAQFPSNYYGNATVPAYADVLSASVQERGGVLYFSMHVNGSVPAKPSPGFAFNHFEWVFGVECNRSTAAPFRFLGRAETYDFNALIGVFYNPTRDGLGLGLGWHAGFLGISNNTPSGAIPFSVHGSTLRLQANASWLGNPTSFRWAVGVGIDPVPAPQERWHTTLIVCYVPNHGTALWP